MRPNTKRFVGDSQRFIGTRNSDFDCLLTEFLFPLECDAPASLWYSHRLLEIDRYTKAPSYGRNPKKLQAVIHRQRV